MVVLVLLAAVLIAGALAGGAIDPIGPERRGYTLTGLALGVLAVLFSVGTMLYSLRKRSLQERMGGGSGTMVAWLWVHTVLGLGAVLLVVLHAGLGTITPRWSTGKLLLVCFGIVALSGMFWRLAYRFVPGRVAHRVGNYSEQDALHRAERLLIEITKLRAGQSDVFRQAVDQLIDKPKLEPAMLLPQAPQAELDKLVEVQGFAASRGRALARAKLMRRSVRRMQRWRALHVPFSLLMFGALIVHVVGALELFPRLSTLGAVPFGQLSGFQSAGTCRGCHSRQASEWSRSMHAHALRSPLTLAQNNQYVRALPDDASKAVRRFCINCHGPVGAALSEGDRLPLERENYSSNLLNEGIGCVTCHTHQKGVDAGSAGLVAWQDELKPGRTYYGPIKKPVANAFHRSRHLELFEKPERLCLGCHNVTLDKNGDGEIERGIELVLQTTDEEYEEYREEGGRATCIDCHMPRVKGEDRAADGARLYFEQDAPAPKRKVRNHSFVGADVPLGEEPSKSHEKLRRSLLRRAARVTLPEEKIQLDDGKLTFDIDIENVGAGHNLPSGFAFARQMWLEVKVRDRKGKLVFSSGVLKKKSHDLCDASTMDERGNPGAKLIRGCDESDPQLVNFQQKLYDRVEILRDDDGKRVKNDDGDFLIGPARKAKEAFVQGLDVGVVARVRPHDKKPTAVLPPRGSRSFGYEVEAKRLARGTITVRLLFRNLPPYFLRGLAKGQKRGDGKDLNELIGDLVTVEMTSLKEDIP